MLYNLYFLQYTCHCILLFIEGSVIGHWVKVVQPVRFLKGYNDLLLLTQTVGLQVKKFSIFKVNAMLCVVPKPFDVN